MQAKSALTTSSQNYFILRTAGGQDINRPKGEAQGPQTRKGYRSHPGWALGSDVNMFIYEYRYMFLYFYLFFFTSIRP